MTTLISFLGKNRRDPTQRYQRATYEFGDGRQVTTPFFGSALMQQLRPERTLLLGTAGSMWDALDIDVDTPEWVELEVAVEAGNVDQPLLDRVSPQTRATMSGAQLVLMPYARTEVEQMNLLADLADRISEGERVVLDITHGFRHLPMLALVAARYLTQVRNAVVSGIYYGALEMTPTETGITPVLKLDGLLRMLDWVEAFAAHDASGNYSVFARLLVHDGMKPKSAELLGLAAHQERVTNASGAAATLSPLLGEFSQLGGATRLFAKQLQQRLEWARKPSRGAREWALHEAYLARKDFLRATIYLQEAAISDLCARQNTDNTVYEYRKSARDSLKASTDFRSLSDIRNLLAHGVVGGDPERAKSATTAAATAAHYETTLHRLSKSLRHATR